VSAEADERVDAAPMHIGRIAKAVDGETIRAASMRIAVDSVNGAAGAVFPKLLEQLGVDWVGVHNDLSGEFPHNPEPRPEHLVDLSGLLKETEGRNAELAVINSVQAALAAELNIQDIYDAVGDQIVEIFDAQAVLISTFDYENGKRYNRYNWEKGQRFHEEPAPISQLHKNVIASDKPLVFNTNAYDELTKLGAKLVPGTEPPLSAVYMPLIANKIRLLVLEFFECDLDAEIVSPSASS